MAKKFFTRLEVQTILESNSLSSKVSYMEREIPKSPDNYIVYERLTPNDLLFADDKVHMAKALIQVTHFHKLKLDSIESLMTEHWNAQPVAFESLQPDTDFFGTYYRFEIFTDSEW